MKKRSCLSIIFIAFLASYSAYSQDISALIKQAENFHKSYQFDKAIELYKQIQANSQDSTSNREVSNKLILSENGKSLLQFACEPAFVTKEEFSKENFFLNYPKDENSIWVKVPQNLYPQQAPQDYNIMLYNPYSTTLVYSIPDKNGVWNIMSISKINDTLWTAPKVLNENITTSENEIFPYLSSDEKTLYFASNGHSTMGGYDLYISKWDDELGDWSVAQNMGFPFSSVNNEYFYFITPDNNFSIFASDRQAGPNKLTLYVTKYEEFPLKKEISQDQALSKVLLEIQKQEEKPAINNQGNNNGNDDYTEYTNAVNNLRKAQNEVKKAMANIQLYREEYSKIDDSLKRADYAKKIMAKEEEILTLQENINTATANFQRVEMDFLSKGIIISDNQEQLKEEYVQQNKTEFIFANNTIQQMPPINVEEAKPEVDLTFKIGSETTIADIADFPQGLVYQIQLLALSNKAQPKALKGLSPVFERKLTSGKYLYSAGIFYSYADALKNLKLARSKFPSAIISAYNNNKSLTIKNAQILEQKNKATQAYNVSIKGYEVLPDEALKIIKDNTNRDIAKTTSNGIVKYVIGPFTQKGIADDLVNKLNDSLIKGVEIEKIDKNK